MPIRFRNRYIPLKDDFDTDISLQRREIISVDKGVICESTFSNNYFKYDIEVEDNHNYFCDGILVHNSNSSIFLGDDGLVHAGSRKRELGVESDKDNAGFYKWVLTQDNLCQFVKDNPHLRLFGEWLVPHTLRTYRDDAWHKLYVFDVYDHNQDRFLTYEEYKPMLEEYNIEYIPCLWKINNPTVDMLLDLLPKNTYLIKDGEGFGEGIVVKNYDYVNKYGRVVWGKIVANEFRDTKAKISKLNAMEGQVSIEETIINKCCTEEFIKKEYHKMLIQLENEGKEWDNKCIPELLGRIWKEFIEEETYEFVKKHKLPTINFRTLNGLCTRKIKNTLTEIF